MSEERDLHIADLICPACGSTVGDNHHDRDEQDQIVCRAPAPAAWEIDRRFGTKTNVALNALNLILSDMGRRLTVAQHSRLMRRIEETIATATAEATGDQQPFYADNATLRSALEEVRTVLALCDTRDFPAPEDAEIMAIGLRIGFGALMSAGSKTWADWCDRTGLRGSNFTCGPCLATVQKALADVDRALEATQRRGEAGR